MRVGYKREAGGKMRVGERSVVDAMGVLLSAVAWLRRIRIQKREGGCVVLEKREIRYISFQKDSGAFFSQPLTNTPRYQRAGVVKVPPQDERNTKSTFIPDASAFTLQQRRAP